MLRRRTVPGGQAIATYSYDALGRRATKVIGSATEVYVYDVSGQVAAEYNTTATPPVECGTCFFSADHLGSTRLVTDSIRNVISRRDYLPFGEQIDPSVGPRNQQWNDNDNASDKFTGQERDAETGMDFFLARHYNPAIGRFTSPDPGQAGADPTNPQSWNASSYVLNNPLVNLDPIGLCSVGPDGVAHDDAPGDCGGGGTTVDGGAPDPVRTDPAGYWPNCYTAQGCGINAGGSGQPTFTVTHTEFKGIPVPNSALPSNEVPSNVCEYAGNAPDPSFWASAGKASKWDAISALMDITMALRSAAT